MQKINDSLAALPLLLWLRFLLALSCEGKGRPATGRWLEVDVHPRFDQLLGAGLIDKKKAKQISKSKVKADKQKRRSKDDSLSDAQVAAQQALSEKQKRDKELNDKKNAEEQKKAIAAQIVQLIKHYQVKDFSGDVGFNFTDGKLVKKVQNKVCEYLSNLSQAATVGISNSVEGYYLIVYLEEQEVSVEEIIKKLENKYKIPITTKVVGTFQLY